MGRKSKPASSLGRALIKDRFGHSGKGRRSRDGDSFLHTSEIADGYDWGRLNLQSVTEESSFKEFLSTAELANTEFQAEKLNITFVNPKSGIGLLTKEEQQKVKQTQDRNAQLLGIPRRPKWDAGTSAEELQAAEREEFLQWRRRLAQLQEVEGLLLTPYEKNLEFWRQLWRVVERSDVVVQIVDARNPLMFRCKDLEQYVLEVSPDKMNMILVNKADFLTEKQREAWARYFVEQGVHVAFFSALLAGEEAEEEEDPGGGGGGGGGDDEDAKEDVDEDAKEDVDEDAKEDVHEDAKEDKDTLNDTGNETAVRDLVKVVIKESEDEGGYSSSSECDRKKVEPESKNASVTDTVISTSDSTAPDSSDCLNDSYLERDKSRTDLVESKGVTTREENEDDTNNKLSSEVKNRAKLLTRTELIALFRTLHTGPKVMPDVTTVGLVGYPNVGKSSTINSLIMHKKVSVSATPGKTKHFQTLYLEKDVLLCDCPGLVMPSFVLTKAEMVVNGILPIDQMRDHVPPVTLVASLLPRHVLEARYGLMLPAPLEGEDPLRPPTAEELLNAYGFNRGFMTQNGLPDNPRSARYILKDFVNGKLLYCHAPPGCDQYTYHTFPDKDQLNNKRHLTPAAARMIKPSKVSSADIDQVFFRKTTGGAHQKGLPAQPAGADAQEENNDEDASVSGSLVNLAQRPKPWKNHHHKRNKREKLRRVYGHLDE